jgi:threonine synthase
MYQLIDFVTKKRVNPEGFVFTGEDSPWEILMDLDLVKAKLNLDYFRMAPPCLSKYLALMPIQKISEFVSLRETVTPLIKSKEQLVTLLSAHYTDEYLMKIKAILTRILQKGKAITVSDFQDSVQDALEAPRYKAHEVFSVLDFNVSTGKNRTSQAQVSIKIAGEERQAQSSGVGPVDAVCNALRHACNEQMDFNLTDYKVDIRSQGVDAVVYVELKLVKDHFSSLGRGKSPDIIQASIEAFEEAYNGFYGDKNG